MKYFIYLIAFLEGWTTLSVEIVALRNFTPIIGSNSISTSIILGVILLALSYGYYIGGKISANNKNLEQKLIFNLLFSAIYYFFITFLFTKIVLNNFLYFTQNYFLSILGASIILFFIPVFLSSQTIPLLSELLKGNNSGEKIGKLLFFSTIGSFLGSVSTSVIFFPLIGVSKTAIISVIILTFCAFSLSVLFLKNNLKVQILSFGLLIFFVYFNIWADFSYKNYIFQKSNAYHNIDIYDIFYDGTKKRVFSLDGGFSSGIDLKTKKSFFGYIEEAKKILLEKKSKNILVIGAAGFTFPNDISDYNFVENIDIIDIDGELKEISEKYFLEKKLDKKIHFYKIPARFFINKKIEKLYKKQIKKYDFILIDAYSGKNLPSQMLTKEFFEGLKKIGDNIVFNIIIDRDLNSDFSKNLFTTLENSFGNVYYKNTTKKDSKVINLIISNKKIKGYKKIENYNFEIYTDDKNSIELDLFNFSKKRFL